MNILLFGASGTIGQAAAAELLGRGHAVTGVTRSGGPVDGLDIQVIAADATDPAIVSTLTQGVGAVLSTAGPRRPEPEGDRDDDPDGGGDPAGALVEVARGLTEGMRIAGSCRLVVTGGAGSLRTPSGELLMDTPEFPAAWRPVAQAHARALDEVYRAADDLDWTCVSPAALIGPGERTGRYRTGGDDLLTDGNGVSRITIADFAVALADVIEAGAPLRRRITVAY
jgi:putative NADH-flavin reductase